MEVNIGKALFNFNILTKFNFKGYDALNNNFAHRSITGSGLGKALNIVESLIF